MDRFRNAVCVVTGGTDGIGLETARRFLRDGAAAVVICGRSETKLKRAQEELEKELGGGATSESQGGLLGRVVGVQCHIGKAEDRASLVRAAHGATRDVCAQVGRNQNGNAGGKSGSTGADNRVSVHLVLNAAVSPPLPTILDTPVEAFQKVLGTNVAAQLELAKSFAAAVGELACALADGGKSGGGDSALADGGKGARSVPALRSICLVSSVGGYVPGAPHPAYSVSKTAVFGLTRALAEELGHSGVRVNCVAPGVTETNFSRPIWTNEAIKGLIEARTVLKRLATPAEVAGPICFLCSDDAAYITAETLVVAGGMPASRL